jgi:hypothetical protein
MVLAGASIYSDGVGINRDAEKRIQRIVNTIKAISPSSSVSMRLVKSGHLYEGLLWSKANELPIGIYQRGVSISQVLESIYRRVKKDCLRAWKANRGRHQAKQIVPQVDLVLAG